MLSTRDVDALGALDPGIETRSTLCGVVKGLMPSPCRIEGHCGDYTSGQK